MILSRTITKMAQHVDSPCANVKRIESKRLPILTAEMESSSDESDRNCGYDPDSESDDQDQSNRVLKSKYLDSPEALREVAAFVQPPLSNSPPTLKSRIRAPSVVNLEQLLGNDKKNTTRVMASTMIGGQQCEDSLDFVPDMSSVNRRNESNHHQSTSVLKEVSEEKQKVKTECFAIPATQNSENSVGSILVPRHSEAVGQPRQILTDEDRVLSSQDILPGTPQNHTVLTLSRRKEASAKRVARTLRSGETENMTDIQQQNETIANELSDDNDCKESDSNLITIEDGESPIKTVTSDSEESVKLCEFPVGQPGAVIVALQDYATLDSGTFLNDIIIDFYIKFLEHNILPAVDQNSVQIFSTMFYKRLIQSPKKISKKTAFFETDSTLTVEEKRHYRVAGWTKSVDLFNKKMIIVPICKNSHWFLLIVVNPGALVDPASPCIIVLDSLGGEQTSAVNNLRSYLAWEWKKRKCIEGDTVDELKFSSEKMPAIYPKKPEQENGVDCGVFLLKYVEKIFENVLQFLPPNLLDLSMWFTMKEVGQKRAQIAELIQQLARKQNSKGIINYPDIGLEPIRQFRSNQKPAFTVSNDYEDLKSSKNMTTVSSIKAEESKEKSMTTNRFYSHQKGVPNVKQNIKCKPKKLPKMMDSSNLTPIPVETTLLRVKCPSPRMRRQPRHSNTVKDESPTRLSFDQILEESEKVIKNGARRRTAGGTFLQLIREIESPNIDMEEVNSVFERFNEVEKMDSDHVEKKGNVKLDRPCDYFNDTGMCKFKSGHFSQSGFTRRIHSCRFCFYRHEVENGHPEIHCGLYRSYLNNIDSTFHQKEELSNKLQSGDVARQFKATSIEKILTGSNVVPIGIRPRPTEDRKRYRGTVEQENTGSNSAQSSIMSVARSSIMSTKAEGGTTSQTDQLPPSTTRDMSKSKNEMSGNGCERSKKIVQIQNSFGREKDMKKAKEKLTMLSDQISKSVFTEHQDYQAKKELELVEVHSSVGKSKVSPKTDELAMKKNMECKIESQNGKDNEKKGKSCGKCINEIQDTDKQGEILEKNVEKKKFSEDVNCGKSKNIEVEKQEAIGIAQEKHYNKAKRKEKNEKKKEIVKNETMEDTAEEKKKKYKEIKGNPNLEANKLCTFPTKTPRKENYHCNINEERSGSKGQLFNKKDKEQTQKAALNECQKKQGNKFEENKTEDRNVDKQMQNEANSSRGNENRMANLSRGNGNKLAFSSRGNENRMANSTRRVNEHRMANSFNGNGNRKEKLHCPCPPYCPNCLNIIKMEKLG